MKSILDPDFAYTPSYATDIRARFESIRRDNAKRQTKLRVHLERLRARDAVAPPNNVQPIRGPKPR